MPSAWQTFVMFGSVVLWVAPWHVRGLAWLRMHWVSQFDRAFCTFIVVGSVGVIIGSIFADDLADPGTAVSLMQGASAGYALYRAWRDHKPPRHRLRRRATEAVRRLAERMQRARQPARVPA